MRDISIIRRTSISLWALLFSLMVVFYINFKQAVWNNPKKVIIHDILSYYAYLPATFIYHDITLDFTKEGGHKLGEGFYGKKGPLDHTVIITSCGMSMLYFPFFLIAHWLAEPLGFTANGYTVPYRFALAMSSIFYLILGSVFLRKLLLKYFSETVTAITLPTIILTTNLLWYVTIEPAMSHVFSFALISLFMYVSDKWLENPVIKNTILLGLLTGIITLVRPTNIIVVVLLILWKVTTWNELKQRILFFWQKWYSILLMIVMSFIVWMPQFLYWKYMAGSFLYYSYPEGQGFFFSNPQLFGTLFSWRKGFFIYTPVMIFAVAGIGFLYKKYKGFFWPILIYSLVSWYIISSWWDWWYGGGFGLRPFIDSYGVLSFGLAAFLTWALQATRFKKIIFLTLFLLSAALSTWHYNRYLHGSIHWVAMTREAYFDSFWRKKPSADFYNKIRRPDYKLARKGIYKYEDEAQKNSEKK